MKSRRTASRHCVAFSPDGKFLAGADNDVTLAVWEAETGQKRRTLNGHRGVVTSVAFSADGSRLISGSEDRTVKVWDLSMDRAAEKGPGRLSRPGLPFVTAP
ncbi:MAG: hypothetical protein K2R98_15780 [Gemmataceae bacterium]|nr:hypothetical protein [Gemmataceae bacterium]